MCDAVEETVDHSVRCLHTQCRGVWPSRSFAPFLSPVNNKSLGPVQPALNMSPADFQPWFPVTRLRNFCHLTSMDGQVDIQPAGRWLLFLLPLIGVKHHCYKVICSGTSCFYTIFFLSSFFLVCSRFSFKAENDVAPETPEPPQRMTRQQTLTLISIASVNFSSMICYSILGPFFPNEVR